MKYIVCVDDDFGLSFSGRRLSRDKKITEDILKMTEDAGLCVSTYTKKLFPKDKVTVCENFDNVTDEYVFSELDVPKIDECTDTVVVYSFGRNYPFDTCFEFPYEELGFTVSEQIEIAGSSHPKITKTVYIR